MKMNFIRFCSFLLLLFIVFYLIPILARAQNGWGPDMRLTFDYSYNADPRAACCGDTIHLVWWKNYVDTLSIMHDEVFYKRSTDAGETWGADVLLSVEDTQNSTMPEVAVSGNTIHIVWFEDDYGLLYRRSLDGGVNWQQIDSIVPGMVYSSIQTVGDIVYIAGTIGTLGVLRFTKSYDGGTTWQPIVEVTRADASPHLRVITNDTLGLVVSYDNGPAPICQEIYQIISYNGGDSWLDSMMVSHLDSAGSQHPAMDTDDSAGIHITWYDYKYSPYAWTGDIFYRASRDSGNTWETIDSMTVMHRAVASDILAERNNLHLVWEDDRNGFDNNFEIYYRMSSDLGQTWKPEERLTNALYKSIGPSLTCGGGYLHLFWSDLRNYGNNQPWMLYYKRKDLSWGVSEAGRVSEPSRIDMEVFPNPFSQEIRIRYTMHDPGYLMKDLSIKLYDVSGKEVVSTRTKYESKPCTIDTRDLPCGVYFVAVRAGEGCVIRKAVKTK